MDNAFLNAKKNPGAIGGPGLKSTLIRLQES